MHYTSPDSPRRYESAHKVDHGVRTMIKDLERRHHRLEILCAALWELARERLQLTDAEIEAKVKEIDARDGVQDGTITDTPLRCPTCGRVSTSRHWKCLYCGLEFERSAFG